MLSGYILGQLFGQAAGGVLGDLFGWRNVFFVLGGMFALAAAGLIFELIANPQTRAPAAARMRPPRLCRRLRRRPVAIRSRASSSVMAFIEAAWPGARSPISAQICIVRFGLSFTLIGLTVALLRHRRADLCRLGAASWFTGSDRPASPSSAASCSPRPMSCWPSQPAWWLAPIAVDGDRARLLHVPQHAADQCHADDAGSARHRGRDLFLGALFRARRRASRWARSSSTGLAPRRFFSARPWASRCWRSGLRANCNGASL